MKNLRKIPTLLFAALFVLSMGCNQPGQKGDSSEDNSNSKRGEAIPLSTATLEGDELIKTSFGDIQFDFLS